MNNVILVYFSLFFFDRVVFGIFRGFGISCFLAELW